MNYRIKHSGALLAFDSFGVIAAPTLKCQYMEDASDSKRWMNKSVTSSSYSCCQSHSELFGSEQIIKLIRKHLVQSCKLK